VQHCRQAAQHGVARQVAIAVIDALEMVQIDHHQRQRRAGSNRAAHVPVQRGNDGTPVGDPGEGVARREDAVGVVGTLFGHEDEPERGHQKHHQGA
jgi:hypothetical protein